MPGTTYGLSSNGWIDLELFHGWLTDHFLKHAVGSRPLLLLLDGHSSHYNPATIRFAKEHDVIVLCLPPNTTHESQPLDTCMFGLLKRNWGDVCHKFMQQHPGQIVTKYQFSTLFNEAWMKSMVPANIVSGFKKCDVYPFNPDAIAIHTPNVASENGATGESTSGDSEEVLSGMELDKDDSERACVLDFTSEEESRFETRYKEGYDLYDSHYLAWLRHHHPESVRTLDNDVPSIVDAFAHVPLSHPLEPVCDNLTSATQSQSLQIASSTKPVNTSAVLGSSFFPPQ